MEKRMGTGRLEAFSDGVIAIIITIMVLELKTPEGNTFLALLPMTSVLLSYVLSFVYVGIYWNNHHHMLHACEGVSGGILWANLHWLFWLSLIPFVTAWLGKNHAAPAPVAVYSLVLLLVGFSYTILQRQIIRSAAGGSLLERAVGNDWKGKTSVLTYVAAIGIAFWHPMISLALDTAIALMWLVPDRRIERVMIEAK
jgi:uncharacterized membrane protein